MPHNTLSLIDRPFTFYVYVLLVSILIESGFSYAADIPETTYNKLEETFKNEPTEYGFIANDVSTRPLHDKDLTSVRRCVFYTDASRVHYQQIQLGQSTFTNQKQSTSSHLIFVNPGDISRAVRADITHTGNTVLTTNFTDHVRHRVALSESYICDGAGSRGRIAPHERPYMLLVNPCYAPLYAAHSPAALRALKARPISVEGGRRAYELRHDNTVIRLHFDPSFNDSLVRSEIVDLDGQGNERSRVVRIVERWQELPGGPRVAARFTREEHRGGRLDSSLVREVSNVTVGSVDPQLFDPEQVPELRGRVVARRDDKIERDMLARNDMEALKEYYDSTVIKPEPSNRRWWVWAASTVVVLAAMAVVWRHSRKRNTA